MSPELRFFTSKESQILEAMTVHMVETGQGAVATDQADDVLAVMDAYVAGLPPGLQGQLHRALRLFEWGPVFFMGRPRPFTRLSSKDQEAYIRAWAESRLGLRRRVFRALRNLVFLGYYSQSGPRELIGHRGDEA